MTLKCIVFKTHVHTNSITFTDIYRTHEIENISRAVWLSFGILLVQPKQTVCYFGVMHLTFNQLTTLNSRWHSIFELPFDFFFFSQSNKNKSSTFTEHVKDPEPKSRDQISAQYSKVTEATSTVLTAEGLTGRPHCIKSSHVLYVVLCALFYFTQAFSSLYPNCVSSPLPGPRMAVWKVKLRNSSATWMLCHLRASEWGS